MKQAILIQCHNNPEIINAIIDFFPEQYFDFYIHIDKKSNMVIKDRKNVFLVKDRIDVRWGQFSQVQATYSLINTINNPSSYSYCHLISGADFPIKSVDWFLEHYCEEKNIEYIQSNYLDGTSTWSWGGLDRVQCWYPQRLIKRPQTNKIMRILRVAYREFIMRTKIFKRRKYPVKKFYGGSSWWSLTGKCVDWIKNNTSNGYYTFFKYGVCVDEVYFSTLVRYSPYSKNIVSIAPRYMIWNDPNNKSGGPAVIREEHIFDALNSCYPFARKIVEKQMAQKILAHLQ